MRVLNLFYILSPCSDIFYILITNSRPTLAVLTENGDFLSAPAKIYLERQFFIRCDENLPQFRECSRYIKHSHFGDSIVE